VLGYLSLVVDTSNTMRSCVLFTVALAATLQGSETEGKFFDKIKETFVGKDKKEEAKADGPHTWVASKDEISEFVSALDSAHSNMEAMTGIWGQQGVERIEEKVQAFLGSGGKFADKFKSFIPDARGMTPLQEIAEKTYKEGGRDTLKSEKLVDDASALSKEVGKEVDGMKMNHYKAGGPLQSMKRMLAQGEMKAEMAAREQEEEMKAAVERYIFETAPSVDLEKDTYHEYFKAWEKELEKAKKIQKEQFAERAEDNEMGWQKLKAIDSDKIEDVKAGAEQAVEWLQTVEQVVATNRLESSKELMTTKSSLATAQREFNRATDTKVKAAKSQLQKYTRKFEREARKFGNKNDKEIAKKSSEWDKNLKSMKKTFEDERKTTGNEARELERRAARLDSKGSKLLESDIGAETDVLMQDANNELADAGKLGQTEAKGEQALAQKVVQDVGRVMSGSTTSVGTNIDTAGKKFSGEFVGEVTKGVNEGEADEAALEENLHAEDKDLEENIQETRGALEEAVAPVLATANKAKSTMESMTQKMATAAVELADRDATLTGQINDEMDKSIAKIGVATVKAGTALKEVKEEGTSIVDEAHEEVVAAVLPLQEALTKDIPAIESKIEIADQKLADSANSMENVEHGRYMAEAGLKKVEQVAIPALMKSIQDQANHANGLAVSAQTDVAAKVDNLFESVQHKETAVQEQVKKELKDIKDGVQKTRDSQEGEVDQVVNDVEKQANTIASEYDVTRKELRKERWDEKRKSTTQRDEIDRLKKTFTKKIGSINSDVDSLADKVNVANENALAFSGKKKSELMQSADSTMAGIEGRFDSELQENVGQAQANFKKMQDRVLSHTVSSIGQVQDTTQKTDGELERFQGLMNKMKEGYSAADLKSSTLAQFLFHQVAATQAELKSEANMEEQALASQKKALADKIKSIHQAVDANLLGVDNEAHAQLKATTEKAHAKMEAVLNDESMNEIQKQKEMTRLQKDLEGEMASQGTGAAQLVAATKGLASDVKKASDELATDGTSASGEILSSNTAQQQSANRAAQSGVASMSNEMSHAEKIAAVANSLPKMLGKFTDHLEKRWDSGVNAATARDDADYNEGIADLNKLKATDAAGYEQAKTLMGNMDTEKIKIEEGYADLKRHMNAMHTKMSDDIENESGKSGEAMRTVTRDFGVTGHAVADKVLTVAGNMEKFAQTTKERFENRPAQLRTHEDNIEKVMNMDVQADTSTLEQDVMAVNTLEATRVRHDMWQHTFSTKDAGLRRMVIDKLAELGVATEELESMEANAQSAMGAALKGKEDDAMRAANAALLKAQQGAGSEVSRIYAESDEKIAAILADETKTEAEREAAISELRAKARAAAGEAMAKEAGMRQQEVQLEEQMGRYEEMVEAKKRALAEKIGAGLLSPSAADLHDQYGKLDVRIERSHKKAMLHSLRTDEIAKQLEAAKSESLVQVSDSAKVGAESALNKMNDKLEKDDEQLLKKVEGLENSKRSI